MMTTEISIITVTSSTLQTGPDQFCVYKTGISFVHFGIRFTGVNRIGGSLL